MNIKEIIARKRDGGQLSVDEIAFVVQGATLGTLPNYQLSAWLMAVYLKGMSADETYALTIAMRDSGEKVDLTDLTDSFGMPIGPTIDKHSTGGVGDKTTLVVVPAIAAAGIPILKMSGRGLGFSGGTVDKLASIPSFNSDFTALEAREQVRRIQGALIGQSASLAPADKALYALRDVTATVESLPLIASSIMSKKLASGGQRILLDVKVGRGAFMKTTAKARTLARTMVDIGTRAGVPTTSLLTAMDEPLGTMVGNALEVQEATRTLQDIDNAESAFLTLCIELIAHGLLEANRAQNLRTGRQIAIELLKSGQAASKFAEIVAAQGGPNTCEGILEALPQAEHKHPVLSTDDGYVCDIDGEAVGRLAVKMGAGRNTKEDTIDPAVGIELIAKTGTRIAKGAPVAILHVQRNARENGSMNEWANILLGAYTLSPDCPTTGGRSPILAIVR